MTISLLQTSSSTTNASLFISEQTCPAFEYFQHWVTWLPIIKHQSNGLIGKLLRCQIVFLNSMCISTHGVYIVKWSSTLFLFFFSVQDLQGCLVLNWFNPIWDCYKDEETDCYSHKLVFWNNSFFGDQFMIKNLQIDRYLL